MRVGVVGFGYLGRFHAEKYAANADVCLVGVADRDFERAQIAASELGTTAFSSVSALIDAGVDAVSVVVPTHSHYAVARELLEAGVHVLVEKPFTTTLEEAEVLIELARTKGCVLQVGHLERFNPALTSLTSHIRAPLFVESHRLAPFGERGTEVDVVLDLMIHDLDIVLWAVRSKVHSVSAVGVPVLTKKFDIANARLTFENGCVANLTASRVSANRMRKIRLFQEDGYFSLDFHTKKAMIVRRTVNESSVASIAGEELDFAPGDALAVELAAFVDSVRQGKPAVVTGEDGRAALEVAVRVGEAIAAHLTEHAGRLSGGLRMNASR